MKRFVFVFLALGMGSLAARPSKSSASPSATPVDAAAAFAMRPPEEISPFFMNPQISRLTMAPEFSDRKAAETVAAYPRTKSSTPTARGMFTGFFTGMFSSVKLGSLRTPPASAKLSIDPTAFPLNDRREINVTYSIFNNSKELSRIEYPTSQRIEILTYDGQGKVIDRWSDDHAVHDEEGIVVINPHERIEYQEKIPTREMKAGQSYKIEAKVASEPNFISQQFVSPK